MDVIWIGPIKPHSMQILVEDYTKRILVWSPLRIHELKPQKGIKEAMQQIAQEEILFKKALHSKPAYTVLLDEAGKPFDSKAFSRWLESRFNDSHKPLTFVFGGAFGFSPAFKQEADELISFSPMTFSHQLIRLVFMEQIYRALSIINHQPYHND